MEKELGSLKLVAGHTYDTLYNLLFTTERAIAMIIQHPLDRPERADVKTLFFGDQRARRNERSQRMKMAEDRVRLYEDQSYDEIVSSHRFNFDIPYHKIARLELTRGLFGARLTFLLQEKLNGKSKIQFSFSKKQLPEVKRILGQAIPSKINNPGRNHSS